MIIAEAGYGKSTLLADFARRDEITCLWYKLDPTDSDWVTFISYLVASARALWPTFGVQTAALLGQIALRSPSRELVVSTFVAELSQAPHDPVMWILDDFHAVDESTDVREIFERMLKDAPDSVHFCLGTRRKPGLTLSRLRAQGQVASIDTAALRFSREETDRLFSEVYGHPLEKDILAQVDDRTEGWAASLQLLNSSIRGRSRTEIRSFVRAMTGAEGPIYDFLAEEVIGDLDPELRNFLLHTSILERITPEYVAAAMERDGEPPSGVRVQAWMHEAGELGLLGEADASGARGLHPLLQEFLVRELMARLSSHELTAMHGRLGRRAGPEDWLTATVHFVRAGDPVAAARTVELAALRVVGTGQSRRAAQFIQSMPVETGPLGAVILARAAIEDGHSDQALGLLCGLEINALGGGARSLVRSTVAYAAWLTGDEQSLRGAIEGTRADPEADEVHRSIAEMWGLLADVDFDSMYAAGRLRELAQRQAADGLHHYAAISLHNAASLVSLAGGYAEGLDIGTEALREFDRVAVPRPERGSRLSAMASASLELGREQDATEFADLAVASGPLDFDAFAEVAILAVAVGDLDRARQTIRSAQLWLAGHVATAGEGRTYARAQARVALAEGRPAEADSLLAVGAPGMFDYAGDLPFRLDQAVVAYVVDDRVRAMQLAREGIRDAERRGVTPYIHRFEVVRAAAEGNGPALETSIRDAAQSGEVGLLQTADVVVSELHTLGGLPTELAISIDRWPDRWLPLLRRAVVTERGAGALAAAKALDDHGALVDVPLLRAYDRSLPKARRGGLGRGLARRVSPRLEIFDLGQTRWICGDNRVAATEIRRKSAALLMYLVSRGGTAAHREQVLEDLWPDGDPSSSMNNLNQTLYFLRRDIERWYEEGVSLDYVKFEGDLLWLDDEVVWTASRAFYRAAIQSPRIGDSLRADLSAFDMYEGRFAPEFGYDDWSTGWRERLHARYLDLAQGLLHRLAAQGDIADAQRVAITAVGCDPEALDIERDLVWLYAQTGGRAAATEQYRHFAIATREQLGIEVPSLSEVLATAPWDRR